MPNPDGTARTASFDAVLETAIGESAALAMRSINAADGMMLRAAATVRMPEDLRRLEDAVVSLRACRRHVESAFPDALRQEMSEQPAAAAAGPVTFDSLELMADEQMDDTVELVRGQQAVKSAVDDVLVPFNALISALQGHERVRATLNPLRPEIWVRALHRSLDVVKAPPQIRALWMSHVSQALGPELATLYRQLCERLRQEGVTAATFRVAAAPERASRSERAPSAGGQPPLTLHALKSLLASVARADDAPAANTVYGNSQTMGGVTMPAAMEALQDMKRMDDVVRRMQERWRQGVWQAETASPQDGVAGSAYTPTQTLAREVVRLMVANIASDARLLAEVQQAVLDLEPALLRLVIHDQRFFSDRQHPARQLLDEVTQRSQAWPDRMASGFDSFLRPLADTVQLLARMPVQDAEPFESALQNLRQTWAQSEERTRRQQAAMARVLLKADQRNHLAAQFAEQLRGRRDVAAAPPEVRRFLLGPWCQVMAAAKVAAPAGASDPGGHGAVVDKLVQIPQRRLAAEDPARRAALGTSLRRTLGAGLAGIGYAPEGVQRLLDELDDVRVRAACGDLAGQTAPGGDSASAEPTESELWLTPVEVSDSALMPHGAASDDFQTTRKDEGITGRDSVEALDVNGLLPGHFVEILVRGKWLRWQLSWASPHGMLYMFADAQGRPQSMTRQILEELVSLGAMRFLPTRSIVDGALDAVAREALENSARTPK